MAIFHQPFFSSSEIVASYEGLRFDNGAAKRKITPRTQEFLKLHKEAYKVALDGEALDKASRAVVQAMDKVCIVVPRSISSHAHQKSMIASCTM